RGDEGEEPLAIARAKLVDGAADGELFLLRLDDDHRVLAAPALVEIAQEIEQLLTRDVVGVRAARLALRLLAVVQLGEPTGGPARERRVELLVVGGGPRV